MTHDASRKKLINWFKPHGAAEGTDPGGEIRAVQHGPSRRQFVRALAWGLTASAALPLAACGGDGDDDDGDGGDGGGPVPAPQAWFHFGVASGDPLADRVILWTQVTSDQAGPVAVQWQVAEDEAFTNVVSQGRAQAEEAARYTLKVDAQGLSAGRDYFYRFTAHGVHSPAGRTRTLPEGRVAQARLAVFSCSNYPAGYFNVYAEAARRGDFDVAVHLGDYIYEYGRDGYASADAQALGRLSVPANEILTLADYRERHAQYRSDADLQALHARVPMIAVWDDHEIANDTYMTGADNHDPATEGDFAARRAAAIQAYHEWMPTRLPDAAQPERIYRSFAFGDLLALHMLDTRVIGREQQLDYADYTTAGGINAAAFQADLARADRQLLGPEQVAWLQRQLAQSQATWQVLGQQVLMARMWVPSPLLMNFSNPDAGVSVGAYAAIVQKAQTDPASLTAEERAVLAAPAIPYNLDAWDGYYAARETVLGTARSLDKNLVVLAGDTHNAWASDLQDLNGQPVGVEFATSSVSSPGFEEYLKSVPPAQLAPMLVQLVETLKYCDTSRRGYLRVTAAPEACRAEWIYVDTIASRAYTAEVGHVLQTLPGAGNRRLLEAEARGA